MKSNTLVFVLVILIGIFLGIAVQVGFNNTVRTSMAPVVTHLKQIESSQRALTQKIGGTGGSSDPQVLARLESIENQLKALETKITAAAPAAPPQPPAEDFSKVYTIDVGSTPIDGKKDAPVTIVSFTDLQCPFCARFAEPVKEVLKAYPDKVNYIMKNFPLPFHPNARPAAKLAFAANEQGKYYEMVNILLQNGADYSEPKVKEYAKTLKLNYKKLMDDVKNNDAAYEKRITEDTTLGEQVDVRGTPTFYLNGKKTQARDLATFKTEIDAILASK